MAHFKMYIDAGRDPRCQSRYVYECGICGNRDIHMAVANFDKTRLRACTQCGVVEDLSRIDHFKNKKKDLESKIKLLQEELNTVNTEIEIETMTEQTKTEQTKTKEKEVNA